MDDRIERFMTPNPACIEAGRPIAEAYERMLHLGCGQLPVLSQGKLVGLLTLQGVFRLQSRQGLALTNLPAFDAIDEPFVVVPGTPLSEVLPQLDSGRVDAAIIVDGGNVLGIFTRTDGLRARALLAAPTPDLAAPAA